MKLARKGKNLTKRIVSLLLVITVLVGTIIVGVVSVNADSNDRIATYIRLAADGSITDGDTSGMTEDQLRFLGLYLSNFYIPFGTELGTNNDDITNSTKEDMVKSLQQKLAFSEELSKSLVETIFGYTRSSMKELSLYVSEHYHDGYEKVNLVAPNYYNFLKIMSGRSADIISNYSSDSSKDGLSKSAYDKNYSDLSSEQQKNIETLQHLSTYRYAYWGYEDGSGVVPVFDAKLQRDAGLEKTANYTPSQIAFFKCLESCNIDYGYGYSFSDFNANDDVDYASLIKDISDEDAMKMTMFGQKMAVDCFGDIVALGANHQIVAVPGCINPYSWIPVDENGEDDFAAGSYYNMINSISIVQSQTSSSNGSELVSDCEKFDIKDYVNALHGGVDPSTQTSDPTRYKLGTINESDPYVKSRKEYLEKHYNGRLIFKANFEVLNDNLSSLKQEYEGAGNNADGGYNILAIRKARGSVNSKLTEDGFLGIPLSTDFLKFLIKATDGFRSAYPNDKTYRYATRSGSGEPTDAWYLKTTTYDVVAPIHNDSFGAVFSFSEDVYKSSDNSYAEETHLPVLMSNAVFIDSLGAYKGKDTIDYKAFNVASFVDDSGSVADSAKNASIMSHSFGNMYKDIKSGKLSVPTEASEQALSLLYVTYCWACLYDNNSKKDTIGKLGYRFNVDGLPTMSNSPLSLGDEALEGSDAQLDAIKNWTYYILHPTKGFNYVRIWLTNKINHLLLGFHSDMVGTNGVGATVGITKYRSNMGYVTMPDLSEINWTNRIIQLYNDCIPFFIVILLILMLIAFIVGALNLQHAIIGLLIFAVFTLLPVPMINGAVSYSNRISQNVYGDKFTYWALVQQESYASAIDEAANATGDGNSSYENYLRTLYAENEKVYSNQGTESILVKWQAPKKMASLVLTEADAKTLGGLNETGVKMLRGMLNNTYSGQSYVDDEDAVYMYRSYLDINNFSRYIYNSIDSNNVKYRSLASAKKTNWKSLPSDSRLNAINNDMVDYMNEGYTNGENFDQTKTFDNQKYIYVPLTSNIINDVLVDYDKIKDFSDSNDMININADIFNFGLPQFNQSSSSFADKWGVETFAATGGITDDGRKTELGKVLSNYSEEDFVGLASYGLYSENPYYYFSWKLYSDGLKADSTGSKEGYKNLLLQKGEGGYFYNTENNGNKELKDFMNMKGLFTYIIPYMKQCNDMVREWDDTFGIYVYDGIPTEEGHWNEMTTDEMKAKYWHNLNVTRLYCIYCPWVDVMYDCSYAKSETINVMGERVTIDDPLDPQKYPSSRPMIFSASEMADYGLSEADLTKVEKKILRCNEKFEERMYELLNYYTFSDITLNSAAAINCAFVFNNTFSENGIFTDNHNIYPQSFDLSNFSYDAFLRLILSNATSEDLLEASESLDNGTATGDASGDFYERLVNRSSTITVIVMLILDVLSVYLIPAFRIFFLVAIFFAAILIVLTSAFRIEASAKFLRKVGMQFVVPLLSFFAATIGFSLVMSLFVGVGNNAVTQTGIFISLGDPVVTMLVMIALDLILLFIYWKIIKNVLKYIRGDAKAVGGFVTGLGAATVGLVAGAVAAGAGGVQGFGKSASRRFNNWRNRNLQKKGNKSLEEIANNKGMPAQDGTGVENGRANERGAGGSAEHAEDAARNRDLEKDKGETPDIKREVDAEERKAEIDSKAASGDIEGSDNDDRKSHISYDTVGSNTGSESADSLNNKASSGANIGSNSDVTTNRAPREKVKQGYKPDAYDREEARRRGIPSNRREGSDAINRSVGSRDVKRDRVPRSNNGGNKRATDRGSKPVETRPNREKVSKPKKDPRIHGNK